MGKYAYFVAGVGCAAIWVVAFGATRSEATQGVGFAVQSLVEDGYNKFKVQPANHDMTKVVAYAQTQMKVFHFSHAGDVLSEDTIIYADEKTQQKAEHVGRGAQVELAEHSDEHEY